MNDTIFSTPKQASEYLHIHLRTLQRLSKQGKIKAIKVGGSWRYLKKDIETFADLFGVSRESGGFLTAIEASRQLKLHLVTIYRLSKQGKIKSYKVGGRWRYLKEDIEKYSSYNTDFSREPARKVIPLAPAGQIGAGNGFIERSAYPRINTSIGCRYSIDIAPFKKTEGDAIIKNMSAGGILLVCSNDDVGIGDPLELKFMDMKAEGRVVRKDNSGLGIKFRNISNEYKERIAEYVG